MVTRSLFAQRIFSSGRTILWVDSASLPSNLTVVVRPTLGNSVAAFGNGDGNTIGQSYRGVHPPR